MKFSKSLQFYNQPDFETILKEEIQNTDAASLPLQQGLSLSSYVGKSPFKAIILNVTEDKSMINVKTGIFYTGIIAGCNCSDDLTPVDEQNEYCELQFIIDKLTAITTVTLLAE